MPLVWVSRWRRVISPAPGSASSKVGRYRCTGAPSSTSPLSTSCMTRVVVSSLVFDPIWNTVSVVVATPVLALITPVANSSASSPVLTASTAPGTRCWRASASSRSWMLPSSATSVVIARSLRGPGFAPEQVVRADLVHLGDLRGLLAAPGDVLLEPAERHDARQRVAPVVVGGEVHERLPVLEPERRVPEPGGTGLVQFLVDGPDQLLVLTDPVGLDLVADDHTSHGLTSLNLVGTRTLAEQG